MEEDILMNIPNKLTVGRFILSLVLIILMVFPYSACGWTPGILGTTGFTLIDLLCAIIFVVGAITDTLDGNIARKRHLVSDFGKFMDPLADKALVNSSIILLAVYKPDYLPAIFAVLFIIRDLAVDGLRFLSATNGVVIAANKWGKAKTVAQMIVLPFIFLNGFPLDYLLGDKTYIFTTVLIAIALVLSLISGGIYLYDGRAVFSNMNGESQTGNGEKKTDGR
jgi:CDP-diacylglycerol--glycerol-3-phosphate 3-phosphatidyltransferase